MCAVKQDEALVWLKRSLAVAALEVGALEPRADQEDPLDPGLAGFCSACCGCLVGILTYITIHVRFASRLLQGHEDASTTVLNSVFAAMIKTWCYCSAITADIQSYCHYHLAATVVTTCAEKLLFVSTTCPCFCLPAIVIQPYHMFIATSQ